MKSPEEELTAVVRWLGAVVRTLPGEPFAAQVSIPAERTWRAENLQAVVFLQEKRSRKVLHAAFTP